MSKKKIETSTGFKLAIDIDFGDDMELFEELVEMEKGNATALPGVVAKILGEKDKKRLYDHVRDEKGKVKITAVEKEIVEIFEALGEKEKKS